MNQDLYLWVIHESKLEDDYYDKNGEFVNYATKFVVEGKKIERTTLPPLNLILKSFSIGYWKNNSTNENSDYTSMQLNFPTDTENRKFTIRIGKVTDSNILKKIENNDYSGITELLAYAKNNDSIISKELTTTSEGRYSSDSALFDGRSLLENKAYYYIYM